MIEIDFSAFSFLKGKLKERGFDFSKKKLKISEGLDVEGLVDFLSLEQDEVEAAFVNHRLMPKDTKLNDGDRVAIVPPGGIPKHVAAYIGNDVKGKS